MYLIGEAADTFSYLMGIANEHQLKLQIDDDFLLEDEFLRRYPGLCPQCGFMVCVCPSVPAATVGRMAKELQIGSDEDLFIADPASFSGQGKAVSVRALDRAGGYSGLASRFPFDRGDANSALILLCLRLADAVLEVKPEVAETLRRAAIQLGAVATYPGSPYHSFNGAALLEAVRETWREVDNATRQEIQAGTGLVHELGPMIGKIRVLFVGATPREQDVIRVNEEFRAIQESIERSKQRDSVELTPLNAATADTLRRALLDNTFDIVHLARHGDAASFLLHGVDGSGCPMTFKSLRELIERYSMVRCVILNSCNSASSLAEPIAPITVGIDDSIADASAIEFSRGFYDAIGAGKDFELAVGEGISAVEMKGMKRPIIRIKNRKNCAMMTEGAVTSGGHESAGWGGG
jgi:hypothetical protein